MHPNPRYLILARAVAALLVPSAALWAAPDAPASASQETKTHILFMGADVSVEKAKKTYPLRNVSGASWIVGSDGKTQAVKANADDVQLKLQNKLKLSAVAASLSKLKTDRVFSPGRDPEMARLREQNALSSYYADQQSVSAGSVVDRSAQATAAARVYDAAPPQYRADALRELNNASAQLTQAGQGLSTSTGQSFINQQFARPVDGRGDFDAVKISFEVSSPVALRQPYVVLTARFQEPNSKPGAGRVWLYARALDAVTDTPRRVEIVEPGFPPGFTIEHVQVNLYDGGTEIPTDVSPKRVALTANEAFQYMVLDYIGANQGATLPAVPFMGGLPPAAAARGGAETLYMRVSREGLPLGIYADDACSRPVADEAVVRWANELRFKPALKKGKPVDSVLSVKPSSFRM